jgi:hypothetical protein
MAPVLCPVRARLIGERVRDKIAASKRKGLWVGGPVPLGYVAVNKKIMVVPAEAAAVRTIFERYLDLGSIRTLAETLIGRGSAASRGGCSEWPHRRWGPLWRGGALAYLLKNRFYIGEVVYRGEVHRGDHAPILDRPLFKAVQAELAVSCGAASVPAAGSPALLTGRLFDDRGNHSSHTNRAARYRYYVSQLCCRESPSRPDCSAAFPPPRLSVRRCGAAQPPQRQRRRGSNCPTMISSSSSISSA